MKTSVQRSNKRGISDLGWLHSKHSFSFADYYNPKRMGFGLLRVFNEDIVEPGKGFGMHFHSNFEIVSIVLEGALEHKDSAGNHDIIKAGDVQRISAGTGISHSEFNNSNNEIVHFLQIWIVPKERNAKPSYEQKSFSKLDKNKMVFIASTKKSENSIYIHQDAYFSMGNFERNKKIFYKLKNKNTGVFVFVIEGQIRMDKYKLNKGDSAEITETKELKLIADEDSRILMIEVLLN